MGRAVKLIHCADIHLDSPLRGLARYDGAPIDDIRNGARRAFSAAIDLCLRDRVDVMLIAGDLYDGDWRDFQTGLFFAGQMARLRQAGIRVVVVRGNHDADSVLTRNLPLPDNVTMLDSRRPQTLRFDDLGLAIHGQSFAKAKTFENLAQSYPALVPGLVNIGLLHSSVGGYDGHDSYAPCSLAQLVGHGYEYWALGHVHQHLILNRAPWVVFPGNIQGRHARETGPKGVVAITIEDGAIASVEHIPTDVLRWEAPDVDVSGAETPSEVLERVRDALTALRAGCDGRMLAVRLTVSGACAAHESLRAAGPDWRHHVDALALDVGGGEIWIEKIVLRTRPVFDPARLAKGAAPVLALLDSIATFADDPEACQALHDELAPLLTKLPSDSRFRLEALEGEMLGQLLDSAQSRILGGIQTGGGDE